MRKLLFGLIISALIFSACQQEYDPFDGTASPVTGDFRAKVDGVQFIADSAAVASKLGGVIVITGVNNSGKRILLRVADSGVHNYSFDSESMTNVATYSESNSSNPNAFTTNQYENAGIYGSMNITSIDTAAKKMSGTFSIKVIRQMDTLEKIITEGVFNNISYASQPPTPTGTDTFRVKINGNSFSYNLLSGIRTFGMIGLSAANINGSLGTPSVGLSVPDAVVPGSYAFDGFTYIGQYNPNDSTYMEADSGTVTILEHNPTTRRIRGNFHFEADTVFTGLPNPNIHLTEGYFSIRYQ
jgi:hypothetical protein